MQTTITMPTMHSAVTSITPPSDTPTIMKMMNVGVVSVGSDVVALVVALLVAIVDALATKYIIYN